MIRLARANKLHELSSYEKGQKEQSLFAAVDGCTPPRSHALAQTSKKRLSARAQKYVMAKTEATQRARHLIEHLEMLRGGSSRNNNACCSK